MGNLHCAKDEEPNEEDVSYAFIATSNLLMIEKFLKMFIGILILLHSAIITIIYSML